MQPGVIENDAAGGAVRTDDTDGAGAASTAAFTPTSSRRHQTGVPQADVAELGGTGRRHRTTRCGPRWRTIPAFFDMYAVSTDGLMVMNVVIRTWGW